MRRHETPEAITPQHRNRLAVGYVRLDEYPATSGDSTYLDHQRDQLRHAERWGWPVPNLLRIEELG